MEIVEDGSKYSKVRVFEADRNYSARIELIGEIVFACSDISSVYVDLPVDLLVPLAAAMRNKQIFTDKEGDFFFDNINKLNNPSRTVKGEELSVVESAAFRASDLGEAVIYVSD